MATTSRFDRDVDGIVLFDKPLGLSSNAALQRVRALYRARKAGHAGSLDPLASGMLPVCLGQATKVCGWLLDSYKTYRVVARLGARTTTGDAEGDVIERLAVTGLTEDCVRQVLLGFLGEQSQVPPMYSALKHEGQRLYELARRGESVERPPRQITIRSLDLLAVGEDCLEFEVRCSKGTYVRTLVEDIAQRLGTVGFVEVLRRLQVDPFAAHQMQDWERLETVAGQGMDRLDALLLPADQALAGMRRLDLEEAGAQALLHGRAVSGTEAGQSPGYLRAYGPADRFLGVVELLPTGQVKPQRLFT